MTGSDQNTIRSYPVFELFQDRSKLSVFRPSSVGEPRDGGDTVQFDLVDLDLRLQVIRLLRLAAAHLPPALRRHHNRALRAQWYSPPQSAGPLQIKQRHYLVCACERHDLPVGLALR